MRSGYDFVSTHICVKQYQNPELFRRNGSRLLPVIRAWQLNERHYGSLQGLNKAEMAEKFGEAQVKIGGAPMSPAARFGTQRGHTKGGRRYASNDSRTVPATESVKEYAGSRSSLLAFHVAPDPNLASAY